MSGHFENGRVKAFKYLNDNAGYLDHIYRVAKDEGKTTGWLLSEAQINDKLSLKMKATDIFLKMYPKETTFGKAYKKFEAGYIEGVKMSVKKNK